MDTIVAPITPLVNSPVIVLRISGSSALDAYKAMSSVSGATVSSPEPNHVSLYRFVCENESVSDDVLAVYFKAPHSFTGEDVVEISFHGNPVIVHEALSTFYSLGFRDAMNGEFSKRAFLNGKIDLAQAEAVQELIAAKTSQGAGIAYKQLSGLLSSRFADMKRALLDIKAVIEAQIDFPDDDTGTAAETIAVIESAKVLKSVEDLLDSYKSLRTSRNGINIVLAGKPNVGKSSLMNALLKRDRAIVSAKPGTTRDYITADFNISGVPVQLVDTAGIRETSDEVESSGVTRTGELLQDADIVLLLLDLSRNLNADDIHILAMTENRERIIVGNKFDLYTEDEFIPSDINVSVKTGYNIDELTEMIHVKAGLNDFDVRSGVATVTERHAHLLSRLADVLRVITTHAQDVPLDMTALDMDRAIGFLEEITGEKYTEKVLDIIFSKFCIGK